MRVDVDAGCGGDCSSGGYAKLLVPRPPVRRLAGPAAEVCGLAPRARLEDGTVAGLGGEAVAFASGAAPVSFLLTYL